MRQLSKGTCWQHLFFGWAEPKEVFRGKILLPLRRAELNRRECSGRGHDFSSNGQEKIITYLTS